MSNKNLPSSPENVESEELLLLDIQTQHATELEMLGITGKAKTCIDPRNLNHLSRASVTVSYDKDQDGRTIEKPTIRFATPSINSHGYRQTGYSYAEIAEVGPDSMTLLGDFTMQDLDATQKMIAGLRDARELGVMPHLSSDLTNIVDSTSRNTGIMKAPPQSM